MTLLDTTLHQTETYHPVLHLWSHQKSLKHALSLAPYHSFVVWREQHRLAEQQSQRANTPRQKTLPE